MERRVIFDEAEGGERAGDERRGHGVAEQIRPAPLAEQLDDLPAAAGEAARRAAERLAERAGDHVDAAPPSHHAALLVRPAAGFADEARRVAVVDHDQRLVLVGEVADFAELRDVAVHAEHAVGGDHLVLRSRRVGFLQLRLQVAHVVVLVAVAAWPCRAARRR